MRLGNLRDSIAALFSQGLHRFEKAAFGIVRVPSRALPWLVSLFVLAGSGAAQAAIFTYDNNAVGDPTISDTATTCAAPLAITFDVTDTFNVGTITAGLNMTHTYRGDVEVKLTSPLNTEVYLTRNNGGSANDFDMLLDDAASTVIGTAVQDVAAPLYDSIRVPNEALIAFSGEAALGTWTLEICDESAGDDGVFGSARLNFDDTPPATVDISLNQTISTTTPSYDEAVTITVDVFNNSVNTGSGLTVQLGAPVFFSYSGYSQVSISHGSVNTGSGLWTIGSLPAGQTATLVYRSPAKAGSGSYLSYVQTSGNPDPDSTPGNTNTGEDDADSDTVTTSPAAGHVPPGGRNICYKDSSELALDGEPNTWAKLSNISYFGSGGSVAPEELTHTGFWQVSSALLTTYDCDIWLGGGNPDESQAESTEIYSWHGAGNRYIVGGCDYVENDICNDIRTNTDIANGNVGINGALAYNPLACGGATGVATFGGKSTYFTPQGSDVILGTHDTAGQEAAIITDALNGGTFLFLPDADMLGESGATAIGSGSTATTNQAKLVLNTFKLALDELAGRFVSQCTADYNNAPGVISGFVYADTNGDDTYQSGTEAPFQNVQVRIFGDPGTPADTSDDILFSAVDTNASGAYSFSVSQDNNYRIEVDAADADLGGATSGTPNPINSVTVTSGGTTPNQNFGFDGGSPPAPTSPDVPFATCQAPNFAGVAPDGLEDLAFPTGYWAASYYEGNDGIAGASGGWDQPRTGSNTVGPKTFHGEAFWGAGENPVESASNGSEANGAWTQNQNPTSPSLPHPSYQGSTWAPNGNPWYQIDFRRTMDLDGTISIGGGANNYTDDAVEVFVNGTRVYGYFPGGSDPEPKSPNEGKVSAAAGDEVLIRYINLGWIGGYSFTLNVAGYDCSDTPVSGTSYGRAAHIEHVSSTLRLGATNDDDTTDIASADADGDGAEDDGVASFPTLTAGDSSYSMAPGDFNTVAGDGTLYAWIDFDGDDAFETTEFASAPVIGGVMQSALNFSGFGSTTSAATTFARFRLTSDTLSNADFAIAASDGEVEDYQVTVQGASIYSCQAEVDIWYGNDESGSVNATEFQQSLDFIYQVSDEFKHSSIDGAQSGIVGWAADADPVDVILPVTDTFNDPDDSGLATSGTTVDGDGNGVRENYTAKVSASTGTQLQFATQGLANRINAGNGRRTGVPQVAVILTDAPNTQINNPGNGGTTLWEDAAVNLRAAGPDGTRIALVLLAEAADAYDNDAQSRATIDKVVGPNGIVIKTSSYAAVADPINGFIAQASQAICDSAVFPVSDDYSDAPISGTAPDGVSTAAYGDATHAVDASILLGATNDSEPASIASPNADGDGAEDDGVAIRADIRQGTVSPILVNVTQANANDGYLQGWIDWDGDGSFAAGERIATDLQSSTAGNSTIQIFATVPQNATTNQTFARFRWSTTSGLDSTTAADDGEVEDYALTILPEAVPTFSLGCVAQNVVNFGFETYDPADAQETFGTAPTRAFTIDEFNIPGWSTDALNSRIEIWESGHLGFYSIEGGAHAEINANEVAALTQDASGLVGDSIEWYVWHRGRAGTDVATFGVGSVDGSNQSIVSTLSTDNTAWQNYTGSFKLPSGDLRFEFRAVSTASGSPSVGNLIDNFHFAVCPADRDYTDAPPSYGNANHAVTAGIFMGSGVTTDVSDYGSANADGDIDDGVTIPTLTPGSSGTITVSTSGANGFLQAWIDWDGNGSFDSPAEQIATDLQDFGTGTIAIPVDVPPWATTSQTFARFRWSTDFNIGSEGAAFDGEVEDYAFTLGGAGTVLSGQVFFDTGAGGGAAHDAVLNGTEFGTPRATVQIFETAGNTLITTGTMDGGGNWTARLPVGFSGEVRVVTTPEAGLRTISEQVGGLPALDASNDPNDGVITFTPVSGTGYSGIDIGVIAEPLLSQDQVANLSPGQVALLPHRYIATTTASVQFSVTGFTSNPADAFSTTLFEDTNCDGAPNTPIAGSRAVAPGETVCLIARTQASNGIAPTANATYTIQAVTNFANTAIVSTLTNSDTINGGTTGEMVLRKVVRNTSEIGSQETIQNSGNIGDILQYRIIMSNPGGTPASNLSVFDSTPAYTALNSPIVSPVSVASGVTCTLVLPAAPSNTAGYKGPLEWSCPGQFAPGETGSVSFDVTILP